MVEPKNKKATSPSQEKSKKKESDMGKGVKTNLRNSIIVSAAGLFFTLGAMITVGRGGAFVFSIIAFLLAAISAYFCLPVFLKERKNKGKVNFTKSMYCVMLAGMIAIIAVISSIADPIAVNVRCSSFDSVDGMGLGDLGLCKSRIEELEKEQDKKNTEEKASREQKQKELFSQFVGKTYNVENEDFCKSHAGNDYPNNYTKSIRFDDESHITVYRCGDSVETYSVKFSDRADNKFSFDVYDPVEMAEDGSYIIFQHSKYTTEAKSQESVVSELERQKAAEASKPKSNTTYTGVDHDENDDAGRYTSLMNKCLDRLDSYFKDTYPLDSADGYPIYYSVTLDSDGSLVEGSMTGHHKTRTSQRVLEYKCVYKNGSAEIQGMD